jgi:hypothetical protein
MERQRIDDEHLIARYLAGQLDARDAEEFEAHYAQDPETVREIERVLRMKEGLAILRERGELEELLRERPVYQRWQPALGLAAGLLVVIVGLWFWVGHTTSSPIGATIADISANPAHLLPTASSHVLVKMRGPAATLEIPLPAQRSAIELRMIPSARPNNGKFRVDLYKIDPTDKRAIPVGETHTQASAEDGVVSAFLDSAQLNPGHIMVELSPEGSGPGNADVFLIQLR